MASSKLMSRNSDLKRKLSTRASSSASSSSSADFLRIDSRNSRENFVSNSSAAGSFLRNSYAERNSSPDHSNSGTLLNTEISLLDAVGAVAQINDSEMELSPAVVRKTVDDVWREILEGKKSEKKQPKEEMMTLEEFLVKAGAVEVKKEEGSNGGIYADENNISNNYSGGSAIGMGVDVGGLGRGRENRSLSLLEPMDKAAQQRQRRMIKNRESAARSRERKQAYQVELESMVVRLEEENEQLLKERVIPLVFLLIVQLVVCRFVINNFVLLHEHLRNIMM
ncbi:hypothetical protein RD792_000861 [Penstemon davidsonii]|uniref:BZIP domain-containing protein n=1 Tax=Penstemon davidsonii TaxID=160366 RepID=A0ABR0DLW1_9LAMI|nr:hypothetical protein RD792_000861 [Penstemon davidsonii]